MVEVDVQLTELDIPSPFNNDQFKLLQNGIYDDPEVSVYINQQKDFAFLRPQPMIDYSRYLPRVKKIGQEDYKRKRAVFEKRFAKVSCFLGSGISSLVEIGASDGSFLEIVKREFPDCDLAAVEPDQSTASRREKVVGSETFCSLDKLCNLGKKYDVVCFFHVLEHIQNPSSFLRKIRQLTHRQSRIIVEVPSLFDPLISLYDCEPYMKFYFQAQHPFVYSQTSLTRLVEHNGLETVRIVDFQRYGLENHLNWIVNHSPGGNDLFRTILRRTDEKYISEIEAHGKTDTVIWIGKPRAS